MAIDQQLLEVLACIQCKGPLVVVEGGRGVLCEACQLKFPVRDDVPIFILEEALDLKQKSAGSGAAPALAVGRAAQVAPTTGQSTTVLSAGGAQLAHFRLVSGPKKNARIALELGTCKAIGRAVNDPQSTQSFHVDVTLALDDGTRKLVHQYVTQQFRRAKPSPGNEFGFRRTGDLVLDDIAVSRLHAMIFYDEIGVGVLDLVSKNGTYVNNDEVESRLLQKGDVVKVGDTQMVLE